MRYPVLALIVVATLFSASADAGRWTAPSIPDRPAMLPRLAQPLALDGDINEWGSASCVPVLSQSYIVYTRKPHKWNGPADAGMVVHCAWNDEGLCLAAEVADDDVRNNRSPKDFWKQDCVEFFVDGRAGEKMMTRPYSPGAYQVLVRPPTGDLPPRAVVNERDGVIDGLRVAGKRTRTGYTIEALIPWSAFQGFTAKPGAAFAFQFALDDYDKRDGSLEQPAVISYRAQDNLWQYPQNFIRWELADALPPGGDLGPRMALDVPAMLATGEALPVNIHLAGTTAERADSVRVSVSDGSGRRVFERTARVSPLKSPWKSAKTARVVVPITESADAYYVVRVEALESTGTTLGSLERPCLCVGNALHDSIALIRRTDLRRMSQAEPFRAAQYLGLAARVEQLERWIERRDLAQSLRNAQELEARLDLLSDGRLDRPDLGIFDLIGLTADPEAQVVVEYTGPASADVTFYWGALPLGSAAVRDPASTSSSTSGVTIRRGTRLVRADCVVEPAARMIAQLVADGKPIRSADVDAIRAEMVKALAPAGVSRTLPRGMGLYCGDLHVHSIFSDGSSSPAGMALQGMYCFMDYMALTDHNTIDGALLLEKQLARYGIDYALIIGEEITMPWAHMNAYPLRQVISERLPLSELVKAAHDQGAVIQWNHPPAVPSEWANAQLPKGLDGTGLDAWEHLPPNHDEWKRAGTLPVLTGTTDTHNGVFSDPERTVIIGPDPTGESVAEAIRRGRAAAIFWKSPRYLYGPDYATSVVWSALAEGTTLKTAKAEAIRRSLANIDLAGLLEASQPRK